MKKASIILSIITIVFCAFAGGFLFGRNFNRSDVIVSTPQDQTPDLISIQQDSTDVPESTTAPTEAKLLDINTAEAADFEALPGIGQVLAQRIVDYRDANGPFSSVADLVNVEGIGEKKLTALLDYITVGG